jgi:hypothetical protein
MIQAFSTLHNRNRTFILFAVCGVLAITAKAIGIGDNPPGLLLAFLSVSAFVLAFVHPWRTLKQFLYLVIASVLGFIVSVFLHNLFDFFASKSGGSGIVPGLLGIISAAFFIIAVPLCPAVFIVGAVGSVAMFIRSRRRTT